MVGDSRVWNLGSDKPKKIGWHERLYRSTAKGRAWWDGQVFRSEPNGPESIYQNLRWREIDEGMR